ncbi:MAG: DUF1287 domain-containing protein [Armatimonadota bacterium]
MHRKQSPTEHSDDRKLYRTLKKIFFAILAITGLVLIYRPMQSVIPRQQIASIDSPEINALIDSAMEQTRVTTSYDPSYISIPYPGGDVPSHTGVCSDVIIRSFRKAGVDLQVKVHEDMKSNFAAYPRKWGLTRTDPSIDHRRVPNLMTFFERKGKAVPITRNPADYRPGDVVSWDFGSGKTHIGLVSNRRDTEKGNFLIVHNVGMGTQIQDCLFNWPIIGHYRYFE